MRVLIVEDDRRLAAALRRGLQREGLVVDLVEDGREAIGAAVGTAFDVIVLDVMLPGEDDGFAICAELRDRRIRTPVLMLTALDAVPDRVQGLNAGADDYLVKPFAFSELLARLRALTRRHLDDRSVTLRAGDLEVDMSARRAMVRGTPVALTMKELAILEYLMHHPDQLITTEQIEEHVWNYDYVSGSNLVEVYIGRIRRKLAAMEVPNPFATVRGGGGGYRFEPQRLSAVSSAARESG
jgi:DNA-binding response OmpR family regulator